MLSFLSRYGSLYHYNCPETWCQPRLITQEQPLNHEIKQRTPTHCPCIYWSKTWPWLQSDCANTGRTPCVVVHWLIEWLIGKQEIYEYIDRLPSEEKTFQSPSTSPSSSSIRIIIFSCCDITERNLPLSTSSALSCKNRYPFLSSGFSSYSLLLPWWPRNLVTCKLRRKHEVL